MVVFFSFFPFSSLFFLLFGGIAGAGDHVDLMRSSNYEREKKRNEMEGI